jgi:hypothetical protein
MAELRRTRGATLFQFKRLRKQYLQNTPAAAPKAFTCEEASGNTIFPTIALLDLSKTK